VKILPTSTEHHRFKEPVKQKLAEAESQIESLEATQRKLKTQIETAQMQAEFIPGLSSKTEDTLATCES
jgi:F0F1-type ATP synthase membrane subunit b/b'